MAGDGAPLLYGELADWWPLLSPPSEYAEEAAFHERVLRAHCEVPPRTLLELGCGGGSNASYLKASFALTLSDLSPGMLEVSRALNPECEHVQGDMRTLRLGRSFDLVFVHDAVCYLTREADLRAAIETAFLHCAPGGAALFAPDYVRESFSPRTDDGGVDASDGRGLRYLEWTRDPDPSDTHYVVDFAYLLRERDGSVRALHDRHVEGLFPRADWLAWLGEAGFQAEVVPVDHAESEPCGHEVFACRRPAETRT